MITVYYRKVFPSLEEDTFSFQMKKLTRERREKLLRIKNDAARLRSLSAGALLHDALCKRLGVSPAETEPFSMGYGDRGKPYLTEYPEVHFNLSHSGEYVCCAVGDKPVGADLQQKVRGREGLAERFFTPSEKQMLAECEEAERQELFFRMWSIKESYLKLTGEGLSGGLSSFEILWQERAIVQGNRITAYFQEADCLTGYSLCVCAERKYEKIVCFINLCV